MISSTRCHHFSMAFSWLVFALVGLGNCNATAQVPGADGANNWPQSSGPNRTWIVDSPHKVPTDFSVRSDKNVLWKMELHESGQGGLTVWEDKVFLSVMKPILEPKPIGQRTGDTIVAMCVDATKQKILWQHEMKGTAQSRYMFGFSDSTTPAPVTDGMHVWFFNASGLLTCFDMDGNVSWEREWKPIEDLGEVHYPFNKQFEPILHGDLLINMETYWEKDDRRVYGWNYLYGIDKNTGKDVWISEDSLTHYNTPIFSTTSDGKAAMMIGRGGYHEVPETPTGCSLIDLENGKVIWRYETDEGTALFNSTWNEKYALWFTETDNVIHKLDAKTGGLIEKISLSEGIQLRTYNKATQQYEVKTSLPGAPETAVWPAWYTNIIVDQKCYFMCFGKKGRLLKLAEPEYCLGRVDLETGKAEYLEVPVQYDGSGEDKELLWHVDLPNKTNNIRGIDVADDKRSKRDGWSWNFNANPICVNGKLFFTTMCGVVYCIDTTRESFDQKAIISVNDLGPKGDTWTLNTPSFSKGKLFHRTAKHLICIEAK